MMMVLMKLEGFNSMPVRFEGTKNSSRIDLQPSMNTDIYKVAIRYHKDIYTDVHLGDWSAN